MQTRRRLGAAFGAAAIAVAGTAAAQTPPAEATIDRIRRTGVLRIAALPGEMPFFHKDLATGEWSGVAIDMAKSIATPFNARLEYVESTYANSVLDLQANKVDLAFALNPTPQRALAIGFTHAYYMHPFGFVARRGFAARTWDDLNRPEVRVVSLIGSLTDVLLARVRTEGAGAWREARGRCGPADAGGTRRLHHVRVDPGAERQCAGADAGGGDVAAGALCGVAECHGCADGTGPAVAGLPEQLGRLQHGHPPGGRVDAAVAAGDGRESGEHPNERRPLTARAEIDTISANSLQYDHRGVQQAFVNVMSQS